MPPKSRSKSRPPSKKPPLSKTSKNSSKPKGAAAASRNGTSNSKTNSNISKRERRKDGGRMYVSQPGLLGISEDNDRKKINDSRVREYGIGSDESEDAEDNGDEEGLRSGGERSGNEGEEMFEDNGMDIEGGPDSGSEQGGQTNGVDRMSSWAKGIDMKGIARTRTSLTREYRESKPKFKLAPAKPSVSLATPPDSKSKSKSKQPTHDDEEVYEEGEAISDLDEDDFALLGDEDGGSDDDLSVNLSDLSGMSDLDGMEDEDQGSLDGSEEFGSDDLADMKLDSDIDPDDPALLVPLSPPPSNAALRREEQQLRKKAKQRADEDDEVERGYDTKKRRRALEGESDEESNKKRRRLPIRNQDGRYVAPSPPLSDDDKMSSKPAPSRVVLSEPQLEEDEFDRESENEGGAFRDDGPSIPDIPTDPLGSRFGRPSVRGILGIENKALRLKEAKREIANLGRGITGEVDGDALNFLRRLYSFTEPVLPRSSKHAVDEQPLPIDDSIRALAMLSVLAVFMDILPGYRIRPLTEVEKKAKVSQMVLRQREWEEALLNTYRKFLEGCEAEVKVNSKLAPISIKCLCDLLREKTHFNYSVNIMEVVVRRLAARKWDESSDLCHSAVISVFQSPNDPSAADSMHLARQLSKTIRARNFNVSPALLSCMLHLRLKEELSGDIIRASGDSVERHGRGHDGKGKDVKQARMNGQERLGKKAMKAKKEKDKITKEIEQAENVVKSEERERNQTDTLKTLFALYFRIIKLPQRTPLLSPALEGLVRFGHLVNVDFFKDLIAVLKGLATGSETDDEDDDERSQEEKREEMRTQLLVIVTAFELLSGQGEALNVDLAGFVTQLYSLLGPLASSTFMEDRPSISGSLKHTKSRLTSTESELLFRALRATFFSHRLPPSPIRTLAFSKRLLTCCLSWPPKTILRTLEFIKQLLGRTSQLEGMLDSKDVKGNGVWRGEVDDPGMSNPEATVWWELSLLEDHYDQKVREAANAVANYVRD